MTLASYRESYPSAELFSKEAAEKLEKVGVLEIAKSQGLQAAQAAANAARTSTAAHLPPAAAPVVQNLNTAPPKPEMMNAAAAFGLAEMKNGKGDPMLVRKHVATPESVPFIPKYDKSHHFVIDDLKTELMAIELGMPMLLYGHKGTGKSMEVKNIAAALQRPMVRIQHTADTESYQILGQTLASNGETRFELGLLPFAMLHGMIYLADEYDFGRPEVLALYQPVLEGEPLVIKEAPEHLRVIRPAPGFAFVATGNTNGTGDSTGLYQGVQMQNSANYDRFAIAIEKHYLPRDFEISALIAKAKAPKKVAEQIVDMATEIRKQYAEGKLSDTISFRALQNIAFVGIARSSMFNAVKWCFSNKLNATDKAAVNGVAQRYFGA